MPTVIYVLLGIGLGVLYCWAFAASYAYKAVLLQAERRGSRPLLLLNKMLSLAIAACALVGAMILIGADRAHSWLRLAIFVLTWVLSAAALFKIVRRRET